MSVNLLNLTPMEDTTSLVSLIMFPASHTTGVLPPVEGEGSLTSTTFVTSARICVVHAGSPAMSGLVSLCKGKSLATRSYELGAAPPRIWKVLSPPMWFGLTWFLVRVSVPVPLKWHVPQDWTPSLPTCMSQNRALPRAMAAVRPVRACGMPESVAAVALAWR